MTRFVDGTVKTSSLVCVFMVMSMNPVYFAEAVIFAAVFELLRMVVECLYTRAMHDE